MVNSEPEMTREEIALLASKAKRGLSAQTIDILTAILVDNEPQRKVAEKFDVTQQAISKAKKRFMQLRDESGTDFGYRRVRIHPSLQNKLDKLVEQSDALYKKEMSKLEK